METERNNMRRRGRPGFVGDDPRELMPREQVPIHAETAGGVSGNASPGKPYVSLGEMDDKILRYVPAQEEP
jgi:hypothetical protein